VNDIVRLLGNALGFALEVKFKPDRGFEVPVNILDSTRLRQETLWQPKVSLEVGVAHTVEWIRSIRREAGEPNANVHPVASV
jgi:UDP-glucose 4-epimerase